MKYDALGEEVRITRLSLRLKDSESSYVVFRQTDILIVHCALSTDILTVPFEIQRAIDFHF